MEIFPILQIDLAGRGGISARLIGSIVIVEYPIQFISVSNSPSMSKSSDIGVTRSNDCSGLKSFQTSFIHTLWLTKH